MYFLVNLEFEINKYLIPHGSKVLSLSDTFARVYENATVVSQFERAAMIVSIENKMPGYWRKHHLIGNMRHLVC